MFDNVEVTVVSGIVQAIVSIVVFTILLGQLILENDFDHQHAKS